MLRQELEKSFDLSFCDESVYQALAQDYDDMCEEMMLQFKDHLDAIREQKDPEEAQKLFKLLESKMQPLVKDWVSHAWNHKMKTDIKNKLEEAYIDKD